MSASDRTRSLDRPTRRCAGGAKPSCRRSSARDGWVRVAKSAIPRVPRYRGPNNSPATPLGAPPFCGLILAFHQALSKCTNDLRRVSGLDGYRERRAAKPRI
jgi:hypothetical protein